MLAGCFVTLKYRMRRRSPIPEGQRKMLGESYQVSHREELEQKVD
jgi:hypothetical protein